MREKAAAFPLTLLFSLLFCFGSPSVFGNEGQAHQCRFCDTVQPPVVAAMESSKYRKYTPDKRFNIQHLALDITPDFSAQTIAGAVTLNFKAIGTPLEEIRLNAVDLKVLETSSSEAGFKYQITPEEIIFNFSPPIPVGKDAHLFIRYFTEPSRGVYFRTRQMGYAATQLWTQGESIESRHWFPCVDHPIAKFTSELTCHLPAGMVALSNGRQISVEPDGNGLTAFHWLQEKPHANYLIALVAGELGKVEERHGDIPLEFWTIPSELPQAPHSLQTTKNVMEFLEKETGVAYPWVKYAQVAIQDFHWGGMENTTLTTLNDKTLHTLETENLFLSNSLVAHELAHQWFGDFVTCKDWSDTWLNEGFATYYDWLWQGSFGGNNETLSALYGAAKGIFSNKNETRGIVWRKYDLPGEMFNYLAYPKGAWVLHMLRSQLGPELYRKAIHNYLEKHAYQSVTSDDLRAALEEVSGRSFERFFDQWVNGVGAPALEVNYAWDEKLKLAKINIKQTQKIAEDAPLFQFPLEIRLVSKNERLQQTVQIKEKNEDFYFTLKGAPDSVRIDPELKVLAKISFKPARTMLFTQLADETDMVGQLLALDQLADKPDKEAVEKIRTALQKAGYYGVRMRAAEILQQARSDEALAALLAATTQKDARVRNAVVKAVGGFYDKTALDFLSGTLASEKNPGIKATALLGLAPHQSSSVNAALAAHLMIPSYRERLSTAALTAIKTQDDPAMVGAVLDYLRKRSPSLPSSTLGLCLETLGSLQRHALDKGEIRELLLSYVHNPREQVRLSAMTALGNLEDPRAIAVLETFGSSSAYRPERSAAEKALEKIRTVQKPNEEIKGLRMEISTLRDLSRDLKKELETLKKKVEAKP